MLPALLNKHNFNAGSEANVLLEIHVLLDLLLLGLGARLQIRQEPFDGGEGEPVVPCQVLRGPRLGMEMSQLDQVAKVGGAEGRRHARPGLGRAVAEGLIGELPLLLQHLAVLQDREQVFLTASVAASREVTWVPEILRDSVEVVS